MYFVGVIFVKVVGFIGVSITEASAFDLGNGYVWVFVVVLGMNMCNFQFLYVHVYDFSSILEINC